MFCSEPSVNRSEPAGIRMGMSAAPRRLQVCSMLACIAACSGSPGDTPVIQPPEVTHVASIALTGATTTTGPGALRLAVDLKDASGKRFDTTVAIGIATTGPFTASMETG